jgi:hypothetical protein
LRHLAQMIAAAPDDAAAGIEVGCQSGAKLLDTSRHAVQSAVQCRTVEDGFCRFCIVFQAAMNMQIRDGPNRPPSHSWHGSSAHDGHGSGFGR